MTNDKWAWLREVFERVAPYVAAAPKPMRDAKLRHIKGGQHD